MKSIIFTITARLCSAGAFVRSALKLPFVCALCAFCREIFRRLNGMHIKVKIKARVIRQRQFRTINESAEKSMSPTSRHIAEE